MFWSSVSCLSLSTFIWILITLKNCQSLELPEHTHEKCISKSDASDIRLNCESKQRIAIHEAFFMASVELRCPFSLSPITESVKLTSEDYENMNYPRNPPPCTDDLRLSIIRKCSGNSNCEFNLMKDHIPECVGEDGSVIIRYTCVAEDKFNPFCNLNLTGNYGYVSTPGNAFGILKVEMGQIVQIDILDVAIKEPTKKPNNNRRKESFICTDKLVILEENTKMLTLCGEEKTNLVQHRTKSNRLTIDFTSTAFSPSRGILFKYSLQNCPTLPAPKNGHVIRNGSFAYYTCCVDHVFEDTKETDRILYCEFGNRWNSSVPKCIAKELLISSSLTLVNDSNDPPERAQTGEKSTDSYISDLLVPVLLMITLLLGNAVIIWVLFRLKRKQKTKSSEECRI